MSDTLIGAARRAAHVLSKIASADPGAFELAETVSQDLDDAIRQVTTPTAEHRTTASHSPSRACSPASSMPQDTYHTGLAVFHTGDACEIQRIDDAAIFASDEDAVAYVDALLHELGNAAADSTVPELLTRAATRFRQQHGIVIAVDRHEQATILAALRTYQKTRALDSAPDVSEFFAATTDLVDAEIDVLCLRLNS